MELPEIQIPNDRDEKDFLGFILQNKTIDTTVGIKEGYEYDQNLKQPWWTETEDKLIRSNSNLYKALNPSQQKPGDFWIPHYEAIVGIQSVLAGIISEPERSVLAKKHDFDIAVSGINFKSGVPNVRVFLKSELAEEEEHTTDIDLVDFKSVFDPAISEAIDPDNEIYQNYETQIVNIVENIFNQQARAKEKNVTLAHMITYFYMKPLYRSQMVEFFIQEGERKGIDFNHIALINIDSTT